MTSWHFVAGGNILGQKHAFLTTTTKKKKKRKTGIMLQNSRDPSKGRNFTWFSSERVLKKKKKKKKKNICDDIINAKLYL